MCRGPSAAPLLGLRARPGSRADTGQATTVQGGRLALVLAVSWQPSAPGPVRPPVATYRSPADSLLILPNVCPLSVSTLEHAAPPPAGGLLQRTESPPRPRSKLQRRHLPSTFVWAGASTRSGDEAHTVRPRGSPLTVSHFPLELVPEHKCCHSQKRAQLLLDGKIIPP